MDGSQPGRLNVYRRDDALGRWTVAWCRPHPALSPLVTQLWFGEGRVHYRRDRILPDGGSMLLFNLGPAQYRIDPGPPERRVAFKDIWYCGPRQTPLDTAAPNGSAVLGVGFSAGGSRPWLHCEAEHCAQAVIPLTDLIGDTVLSLRQRLLETPGIAARFALVEHWLLSRLSPRHAPHPALVRALQRMNGSGGQVPVEALARAGGLSRKHLGSLFRREVGLGPKSLARVLRFRSAVRLLEGRSAVPWAALAASCGYYDQSHLLRDFRAFSGLSPAEFARRTWVDASSIVIE